MPLDKSHTVRAEKVVIGSALLKIEKPAAASSIVEQIVPRGSMST